MTSSNLKKKPVAGVDTPAADDIITQCKGRACKCGGWVVTQHPTHTLGGGAFIDGKCMKWEPTPEWVEAEAKRIANGGRSNARCGRPMLSAVQMAEAETESDSVNALRHFTGEEC